MGNGGTARGFTVGRVRAEQLFEQFIKDYRGNNRPTFRIRVWERPRIEQLLGKHPDVRSKFFPEEPTEASSKEPRSVDDPIIMSRPEGQPLRDIEELQEKTDTALRQ